LFFLAIMIIIIEAPSINAIFQQLIKRALD
jgi:hypothetical protein